MSTTDKHILLLTHARTASHFLERMLSTQPGVAYSSHPFVQARVLQMELLEQGPISEGSQKTKDALFSAWQDNVPIWEELYASASKKGKTTFLHCHPHFMIQPSLFSDFVYGGESGESSPWVVKVKHGDDKHSSDNPTVIPDALLLESGTVPIFTIRHPVTMVASIYGIMASISDVQGPSRESLLISCSLHWQRLTYDWYVAHGKALGIKPMIVDADDYQGGECEAFMGRLCDAIGLDKSSLIYSWNKASTDELDAMGNIVAQIKKTLVESDGVIRGLDTKSLDLKQEKVKWVERFGEKGAKKVQDLVERTMEDYEYLRAKKFT